MQIAENGGEGAELFPGRGHRLLNNTVFVNDGDGINCAYCVVTGNVIYDNGGDGIEGAGGTFIGNLISQNTELGLSTGFEGNGHGQNTLYFNNGTDAAASQVSGAAQLDPNFCGISPCP
jgi:hypothetical protein